MGSDLHKPDHRYHGHSDLFLVRVWVADAGEGPSGWLGRVQQVVSGEVQSFRGPEELVEAILGMLPQSDRAESRPAPPLPVLEEGL
jgi:hypothetical protein